jgi:hypothetical protein
MVAESHNSYGAPAQIKNIYVAVRLQPVSSAWKNAENTSLTYFKCIPVLVPVIIQEYVYSHKLPT